MYRRITATAIVSIVLLLISQWCSPRILAFDPGDPRHSRPHLRNTIEYPVLLLGIACLFSAVFYKYQSTNRKIKMMVGLGFVAALLLTNGITENTKNVIGRLRPDFLARCSPNQSGVCTGSRWVVREGRKSFPSGHTSTVFCAVLLILYILRIHGLSPVFFLLCSVVLLGLGALVGLSRVLDNKHFPTDVLGGAAIGTLCGCAAIALIHSNMKGQITAASQ